jgi:hypothetical protein
MRRQDEHLAQTSRDECHCTFPMRGAVMASTGNTNHTRPLSMQKEYKVPQLEPSLHRGGLTHHGCSAVKMVGTAVAGNLPEEMDGLLRDCGQDRGHLGEAG